VAKVLWTTSIVASLIVCAHARGDLILKTDGGRIEGEVLREKSNAEQVTIKTRFGTVNIPRSEIREIHVEAEAKASYEEERKKTGDNADEQYELALWCLDQKLTKEYRKHLERTIELEPDHEEARRRLGFERRGDKWLTEDEAKSADGYVKYRGRWMLPQERVKAEADRDSDKKKQDLSRTIRSAQHGLRATGKTDRMAAAREELLAIKDPAAIPLLMQFLFKKGEDNERRVVIDVLKGIEGDESTDAVLEIALTDKLVGNRQAAIEVLEPRKSAPMVAKVMGKLKSNENSDVKNAADILARVGDSSCVPPLVDALVTTHRRIHDTTIEEKLDMISPAPYQPTQTMILPDGTMVRRHVPYNAQSGVNIGQSLPDRQVIVTEQKNGEVLDALIALTGENFGFNKKAWLDWLASQYRANASKAKP